jgi:hypothetical protein
MYVAVTLVKVLVTVAEVELVVELVVTNIACDVDDKVFSDIDDVTACEVDDLTSSDVDTVVLLVESRTVDDDMVDSLSVVESVPVFDTELKDNVESVMIVGLDVVLFVCVWARAIGPDLIEMSNTSRETVIRIHVLILFSNL